jgi:hypothetical protein
VEPFAEEVHLDAGTFAFGCESEFTAFLVIDGEMEGDVAVAGGFEVEGSVFGWHEESREVALYVCFDDAVERVGAEHFGIGAQFPCVSGGHAEE